MGAPGGAPRLEHHLCSSVPFETQLRTVLRAGEGSQSDSGAAIIWRTEAQKFSRCDPSKCAKPRTRAAPPYLYVDDRAFTRGPHLAMSHNGPH
ncbi:MAG: hypothetical protein JWN10_2428, partial [Solirubrobacterales bacterium]|nr:hypothetical protein [Solirubrobacterales bacterium]